MPYRVEYPHKDKEYELVKRRIRNENALVEKVAELLEAGVCLGDDGELSAEARKVLDNIEVIGDLAKLVDKLGDSVGLAKGWLKLEVLKSIQD